MAVSIISRVRGNQNKMIRVTENRRAERSGVVRNNKKKASVEIGGTVRSMDRWMKIRWWRLLID